MVLVRYRIQKRHDTALIIVEAEIRGGYYSAVLVSLKQVCEDANEVSRLLGLGGNKNLILKKLH